MGGGKGSLEGKILCESLEMGTVGKRGCKRYSAAELGMRMGDCIWRGRGKGEDLQLACLRPWPEFLFLFVMVSVKNFCPFKMCIVLFVL